MKLSFNHETLTSSVPRFLSEFKSCRHLTTDSNTPPPDEK